MFPGHTDVSCLTAPSRPPSCSVRGMCAGHPDPELLVHLCGERQWRAACEAGQVLPESLEQVGFVHLSTQWQVQLPANRLFAGRADLVVLLVNPSRAYPAIRSRCSSRISTAHCRSRLWRRSGRIAPGRMASSPRLCPGPRRWPTKRLRAAGNCWISGMALERQRLTSHLPGVRAGVVQAGERRGGYLPLDDPATLPCRWPGAGRRAEGTHSAIAAQRPVTHA